MDKIIIRPMTPEDWGAVSRIYVEGIATEYATFQTECPPYTAWDASHTKECRLVILSGGVLAVVFDIYRPFMEVLTHPREAIPKYWRWFLPIGLVLPGRGRGEHLCG